MVDFWREVWLFLRTKKRLWLAPIVLILMLLGSILVLAQGTVVAPFVYTLF